MVGSLEMPNISQRLEICLVQGQVWVEGGAGGAPRPQPQNSQTSISTALNQASALGHPNFLDHSPELTGPQDYHPPRSWGPHAALETSAGTPCSLACFFVSPQKSMPSAINNI